jgi:hypothetical protein
MRELTKRVQRLEAMRDTERPPDEPRVLTPENVNEWPPEAVERMLRWYSLRLQVFKPGEDDVRRRFIRLWYGGLRTSPHPDPELLEGWRQLHEEEEAAWAARLPETAVH